MTKMRRIKRDPLRALLSEVLPYEVPLAFSNLNVYRFLRYIKFQWVNPEEIKVSTNKLKEGEKLWLQHLFDSKDALHQKSRDKTWTSFKVQAGTNGQARTLNPYKFAARRNNGKTRILTIPHPQSMLEMARFIDKYSDSILYHTNKSSFSIRHPARVARLEKRRDGIFAEKKNGELFNIEQHNLEYDNISSYFAYAKYSNIHKFYSSQEFRACERKYPALMRADISKCFDSIYTHTISWVINGRDTSKHSSTRKLSTESFGGYFDTHLQSLNYGETSGIVIGPEFSRVFAEVILQEVDVRVERELDQLFLIHGEDYEIMRYVDDYFVFLADPGNADKIEELISRHLAPFKLHLNDLKKELLPTPLRSHMSVAKYRIRKDLRDLTKCDVDLEAKPKASLFFSGEDAIIEYKSTLLDVGSEHGELANFYLYSLSRRVTKTCSEFQKYLEHLGTHGFADQQKSGSSSLAKYLVAVMDVAFFVYSGAPSVSHSMKLSQIIVGSIRELERAELSHLEFSSYKDKIRRELMAQLMAIRDERSFGLHTLNLLDCLVHMGADLSGDVLANLLKKRNIDFADLDAFALLTLIRSCGNRAETDNFRAKCLTRAAAVIKRGKSEPDYETQRAILLLSIPASPDLTDREVVKATGLKADDVTAMRGSKTASLFAWDSDDHYHERLLLKASRMVY